MYALERLPTYSDCGSANTTFGAEHDAQADDNLLTVIYISLMLTHVIEVYISCRQLKVLNTQTAVPAELKSYVDPDTFENIRIYNIECEDFRMCSVIFRTLLAYLELHYQLVRHIWDFYSTFIKMHVNCCSRTRCKEQELYITALFTITMVLYHCLKTTVGKTFKTFILDKYYRHRTVTTVDFINEQCNSIINAIGKTLPIAIGIVLVNQQDDGCYYFLHLLLFLSGVVCVWSMLVMPAKLKFFTTTVAVDEGALAADIKDLAKRANLNLNGIYKWETTTAARHSTGCIAGFGRSKYLLLDQKLFASISGQTKRIAPAKYTNNEILSVVAHEIGHWHHSHFLCDFLLTVLNLLALINMYGYWYDDEMLYHEFGFQPHRYPIIVGIYIIYFYILVPYHLFINIANLYITRRYEYEADRFACSLVSPNNMIDMLIKSCKENMEFPMNDPIYSIFFQSQPSFLRRVQAIGK